MHSAVFTQIGRHAPKQLLKVDGYHLSSMELNCLSIQIHRDYGKDAQMVYHVSYDIKSVFVMNAPAVQ